MRFFIAINLSNELKEQLINIQNQMFDQGARGYFTPEDNMHLTLAFIGEYPSAESVIDALDTVSFTPFEITLGGIGCYGDLWWAGIQESVPLTAVARRIRRALAANNIPFDKPRREPHHFYHKQSAIISAKYSHFFLLFYAFAIRPLSEY